MLTEVVRTFTKGDLLTSVYGQCLDGASLPIDITGQTITFYLADIATGTIKVNGAAAAIVTAATGQVRYDWTAPDIDTVGEYWGWFVRTTAGKKAHHPGQGHYLRIVIVKAES